MSDILIATQPDFIDDVEMAPSMMAIDIVDKFVPAGIKLEEMEISVVKQSLETHSGNVSAAARALGVSRNTIYRKMATIKGIFSLSRPD